MHFAFLKSGVSMAFIAHGLIGISLVWDKVLLKQQETKNLVSYVFWLGAISTFGLALIPFGFHTPSWHAALLGFFAGLLPLAAIYFYYDALKRGEASESLAAMGGFSPVATAVIAFFLLRQSLAGGRLVAFMLLTAGGFLMFLSERMDVRRRIVPVVLASRVVRCGERAPKNRLHRDEFRYRLCVFHRERAQEPCCSWLRGDGGSRYLSNPKKPIRGAGSGIS